MAGFTGSARPVRCPQKRKSLKHIWLHKKERSKLIIFCTGWGMDENPVQVLQSDDFDVLLLYNYSQMVPDIDIPELLAKYNDVFLVSWSMGVWAGQKIFAEYRELLRSCIAINGTLCPIDDHYGIPRKTVLATHDGFDAGQRDKFYFRMCRDRKLYQAFIENQPQRSVADQKEELAALLVQVNCLPEENPFYTIAFIAEHDFIIPTRSQLRFWPDKKVKRVDGSHFLFYDYKSWDALLADAGV